MDKTFVYIGKWALGEQQDLGIAICAYDAEAGALTHIKTVHPEYNVGAAWLDSKRNVLYITDERADLPGMRKGGGGQAVAFAIDQETGDLTEIGRKPSYGANPSYVTIDTEGRHLLLTNHGTRSVVTQTETDAGGRIAIKLAVDESSLVLYSLAEDGAIGDPVDIFRLEGEGPEIFQLGPHAHCVNRSPSGSLYAVCDKGGDQLYLFKVSGANGKLAVCEGSPFHSVPGSAPRYCAFHPTLPYLFVNHEYKPIISAFSYDEEGRLTHIATIDALPEDVPKGAGPGQSDICMDESGRYLYTLLRQSKAVSLFEIDQDTGQLTHSQTFTGICDGARCCAISPDGRYLLITGQSGGEVASYPIASDGKLAAASSSLALPAPGTVTYYTPWCRS